MVRTRPHILKRFGSPGSIIKIVSVKKIPGICWPLRWRKGDPTQSLTKRANNSTKARPSREDTLSKGLICLIWWCIAVFVALLSPEVGADVEALFVVDSLLFSSTSILEAGEVVLGAATEAAAARVSGSVVRFSMATVTLKKIVLELQIGE